MQNMPTKNEILAVRDLRNRKSRKLERKFTIEGVKGVNEALRSGWQVHGLYSTADAGVPDEWGSERVSTKDMERMSAMRTAPGVLAVMGIPDTALPDFSQSLEDVPPFTVALDGVSDPGNLGAIVRTADWFGIPGIWVSEDTVDPFNPKVVQATMGAIFRVAIWSVDLAGVLTELGQKGVQIRGLDLDGDALWSSGFESDDWGVAVVGSESHGLSPAVKEACSGCVHIPGTGLSESLNAAMAAGIVMAARDGLKRVNSV
jgi:RNA methyltransferase, TrmH family